jgi:hypothetical protein
LPLVNVTVRKAWQRKDMLERRAIKAGLLYCAVVFCAGFLLGSVRTFWVAPLAGEFVGVLLEAPVMLAISWVACGWVAERLEVSESLLDRLIMGGVALAVLILAEAIIAIAANRKDVTWYFLRSGQSGLLLGLLAQLAFAVFPMVRRRRTR